MRRKRKTMESTLCCRYSARKSANPVRSPSCRKRSLSGERGALTVMSKVMLAVVGGRGRQTLSPVTQSEDRVLHWQICCSLSLQTVQFWQTLLRVEMHSRNSNWLSVHTAQSLQ